MSTLELKGLKSLRSIGQLLTDSAVIQNENIVQLAVDLLSPGRFQPRKQFNESILAELSDSILAQGIIQPLIVRRVAEEKYEIIAGERRWRAATIAGLSYVPAIIRNIEDKVALAFSVIENIQREDLNPIEEAIAFSRFREEFQMTHEEIANMLGRSRASVTNTLRLLTLDSRVRLMLEEGSIDMGHARTLLTLDSEQQYLVACLIKERKLSVREAEELSNTFKLERNENNKKNMPIQKYHEKCGDWSHQLSQKFATNVSVKVNQEGKGKVVIEVNSPDEVDWIVNFMNEINEVIHKNSG
ncbi:ParB/RepB/Spo0J family partition protein [Legionella drancourtii]|uniref:Probable chromosome-partitioning protein ParB n=1 Tax=Legionella drancourtii LLAP12 TaxID=658187 RepID=G9ESL8_9GAMM|nr:ParB/RepB/Spo0J family partition protein [Legionella drancourtii]EHL29699.1 chromosome partitioning protein [Legionella drancourtii LLAP12]